MAGRDKAAGHATADEDAGHGDRAEDQEHHHGLGQHRVERVRAGSRPVIVPGRATSPTIFVCSTWGVIAVGSAAPT